MIVNVGKTPTPIQQVKAGDIIFNTGLTVAYVDTVQANVLQAPLSSAVPVLGGATVQWAGAPGLLYGKDPTGSAPGIGVTSHSGLPFPAPTGGPNFLVNSQGFFWYTPSQGRGNLVLAIAPGGGGIDPFGDVYPQGTNFGIWSPAGVLQEHFGIDTMGNLYIVGSDGKTRVLIANGSLPTGPNNNTDPAIWFFNDFGAVTMVVDPSAGGSFQYQDNGNATQGPLIGSQVGKNTNDPVSNQFQGAGINVADPVFGDALSIVGANINWKLPPFSANGIDTINQGSGATGPYRHVSAPEQGHTGHAVQRWIGTSVDGTVPGGTVVSLTDPPVRATAALAEFQGGLALLDLASAPASVASYVQLYADQFNQLHTDKPFQTDDHIEIKNLGTAPGAGGSGVKLWSNGGHGNTISGQAGTGGDSNDYDIERLSLHTSSTQTINSTTATTIAGLSHAVGVGTYLVRATIVYTENAAAGVPSFAFAYTGTTTLALQDIITHLNEAAVGATTVTAGSTVAAMGGVLLGITMTAAATLVISHITGIFTFTSAGTLSLQGKTSIAADTWTTSAGCHMTIEPVTAS